jgi:hypothetical protein
VLNLRVKLLISLLLNISFTLWTYRSVFSGRLIGEPFDSRLQIILHEHWWRWFNGLTTLRDTEFFYPFDRALGFSDVFLVQGTVYSIFRFIGFGFSNAWTFTTFLLLVLGNLGWTFIALRFFRSFLIQTAFLLTIISSVSFVSYFIINPNIVGYSFLPWISLLIMKTIEEKDLRRKNRKISHLITILLIYSLSCWYGAFFLILILVVRILLEYNFNIKKITKMVRDLGMISNIRIYLLQLPIQLSLIWLFIYIYVPSASANSLSIDQLILNSPRLESLPGGINVNATKESGAFFRKIYLVLGLSVYKESAIGIGFFATLLGIITLAYGLLTKLFTSSEKKWIMTLVVVYGYFLTVIEDFSIHSILYKYLFGFNSIRYPGRIIIFIGFFILFGIFLIFDKLIQKSTKKKNRFIILTLSIILLLDQYRAPYNGWGEGVLVNNELRKQKEEIKKNCDYFYYDFSGGWWYEQIEAMFFSMTIGVPTVNGYSGSYPAGYPNEPFESEREPIKIFEWIAKIDPIKRGCLVNGRSEILSLNKGLETISFVGFTGLESKGDDFWRWSVSPNAYLYIVSYEKEIKEIFFEMNSSNCNPLQKIKILGDSNRLIIAKDLDGKTKLFNFDVDMRNSIIKRVQIISDSYGCREEEDPRVLFYEVKNFKIYKK